MNHILDRLRKILALARDSRANAHIRARAEEAARRLAARHGIDLATVNTSDPTHGRFNLAEVVLRTRRLSFEVRVCTMLASEVFRGLKIRGKTYFNGPARLDFLIPKPGTPDGAVKLFEFLLVHTRARWKELLRNHRQQCVSLREHSRFIFGLEQQLHAARKPHHKSFLSGLYHGARENIKRVRAERLRLQNSADLEALARTLLQPPPPPEPFVPPPPNPYALMVINKPKPQNRPAKPARRRRSRAKPKRPSRSKLDPASFRLGFQAGANARLPV
jgi:hypothetical protein